MMEKLKPESPEEFLILRILMGRFHKWAFYRYKVQLTLPHKYDFDYAFEISEI
jgi:hypothetical protein